LLAGSFGDYYHAYNDVCLDLRLRVDAMKDISKPKHVYLSETEEAYKQEVADIEALKKQLGIEAANRR
jgi:hypothetical protein